MKRLSIILTLVTMLLSMNQKATAQFAVTDIPHMGINIAEWIKNIAEWRKQFSEMVDAQAIREGLQNIQKLQQLQSLIDLAELLDDVACLSTDFSYYLNMGSSYHCLTFLNFQKVTVNLSLSSDLLFKVATVSSYFSMNSEGRISFISQVKAAVEAAAEEMQKFNEEMRRSIITRSILNHNKKVYYSGTFSAYNRYQ